ncbi:MAG: DUF2892 domain-containing protein [Verrucomicrobia bacterium]|nr:DUF2892 domain-containing protein [Verrucomicrobiota bacterium]
MAGFWRPNIGTTGRLIRGALGVLAAGMGVFAWNNGVRWLAVVLALAALFLLFEALRGWCAMRACGVRTLW